MQRVAATMKPLFLPLTFFLLATLALKAQAEVVVIVSAQSDLQRLRHSEVADIFLGKINRYPDGRPVVPVDHDEASVERRSFYALFTGHSAAEVKAHWSRLLFTGKGQPPRVFADSVQLLDYVAANAQAIAYVDPAAVNTRVRVLTLD